MVIFYLLLMQQCYMAPLEHRDNLHRIAASLHDALDVYRLALVDLQPAVQAIVAAGEKHQPLPMPSKQVFERLAQRVQRRVASEALTPLARVYHKDAAEALMQLAEAQALYDIPPPLGHFLHALGGMADLAHHVVDIFSQQHHASMQLLDPDTALNDINEALDELAIAESTMQHLSNNKALQLQAFLRLDTALGHVLDRIANAQESGVQLGFDVPWVPNAMADVLQHIDTRSKQVAALLQTMQHKPHAAYSNFQAYMLHDGTHLHWTHVALQDNIASIKIYKKHDDSNTLEQLIILPATADTYVDTPHINQTYAISVVSVFGIESQLFETTAIPLLPELQPPQHVTMRVDVPDLSNKNFYHDIGAVHISWYISLHDVSHNLLAEHVAKDHNIPIVHAYTIYRVHNNHATRVAQVNAGATTYIDYPNSDFLADGLLYMVEATDFYGKHAHAISDAPIQMDIRPMLAQARAGATYMMHPTQWEQDYAKQVDVLKNPKNLQDAYIKQFWQQRVGLDARALWQHMDKPSNQGSIQLYAQDMLWAQRAAWLLENPHFVDDIEFFWQVLDAASKQQWLKTWQQSINQTYAAWFATEMSHNNTIDHNALELPAHLMAFWQSRDVLEQTQLNNWWQGIHDDKRNHMIQQWLPSLPQIAQTSILHPDWSRLSADEQTAFKQTGYAYMPDTMWREFFAWAAWQKLDNAHKIAIIRQEVSIFQHALSVVRYSLRPLDVWFDFELMWLLCAVLLVVLSGFIKIQDDV